MRGPILPFSHCSSRVHCHGELHSSYPLLMPLQNAKKRTAGNLLKDKAYSRLKERILTDRYGPGTFLSERQVSEWLGMSKTPIKAAFERLEHEGYISISPQQGVVVKDLTIDEIGDNFEFRVALESYVTRSIAGQLMPTQIEQLRANLERQKLAIEADDFMALVKLDEEFHLMLCEFLGNREIARVMRSIKDKITRVIRRVYSRHPQRLVESFEEHKCIMNHLIEGEAESASQAMIEHLERSKRFLLIPKR